MQIFYEGWRLVQAFMDADAKVPREVALPRPVDREICRMLEERREFAAVDVIDAMRIFAQPELLETSVDQVRLEDINAGGSTSTLVAPVSMVPAADG